MEEELLKEILKEQKKANSLLQTIVNSQKQSRNKCCLCGDLYSTDALLELSDGKFVCETCAMTQGELADD
ncbi:hypothetical protein LDK57_09095 [Melissococcus plutonius]|uniref:hypothetical protein n=1 Tax=Melissococcus plutonius TaxID=33970 RepID=UPI0021E5DF3D|nr:hypothetical protein [Melissococcus plutonius]MCV2508248.1 hypothetical protein [Melissococcus plutonius]